MRSRKGALSLDKKHRCLSFDGDCSNLGGSSQWTSVRLCEHFWIEHVLLSFATADPNGITTRSIGLIPEPLHSGQTVALHYWLPSLCWFPSVNFWGLSNGCSKFACSQLPSLRDGLACQNLVKGPGAVRGRMEVMYTLGGWGDMGDIWDILRWSEIVPPNVEILRVIPWSDVSRRRASIQQCFPLLVRCCALFRVTWCDWR